MPDKIPQTVSCTTNTDLQQRWRIGKASNEKSGTRSVTYVGRPEAGLGFLHARTSKNPMARPWRGACPDRASSVGRRGWARPEPSAIGRPRAVPPWTAAGRCGDPPSVPREKPHGLSPDPSTGISNSPAAAPSPAAPPEREGEGRSNWARLLPNQPGVIGSGKKVADMVS
jgi:hypothetical protein